MVNWLFKCGAPCCMAGHACSLFSPDYGKVKDKVEETNDRSFVGKHASDLLGLSWDEGRRLFDPKSANVMLDNSGFKLFNTLLLDMITPKDAATVLDHLAETGEVNWDVLLPDNLQ